MKYIDTHTHIYAQEFREDIDDVMERALLAGMWKAVLPATDEASAEEAVALASRYPGVLYPVLGLHPEDLPDDWSDMLGRMEKCLADNSHPFVGIGEVGLDFYWSEERREEQMEAFRIQSEWALRYRLPLIVHSRKAHQELKEVLLPYAGDRCLTGIFHCFTGTVEEAQELLDLFPGFMLGIGGVLTFKKSTLADTLRQAVPLQRIVVETDAPYMAPVPHRGQRNEPAFVPAIISRLAEVYGTDEESIARETTKNALQVIPRMA